MNVRQRSRRQPAVSVDIDAMTRHAEESSNLLKAMASTPRLLVLCHLVEGERSVGELLGEIPLSASALSQHLAVLRQKGLVTTRRDAQVIYYALSPGPAVEIIALLYDTFCAPPRSRRHGKRNA